MTEETTAGHRWPRVVGAAVVMAAVGLAGCEQAEGPGPSAVATGNPDAGKELMVSYGCGSCHTIPGVPGADALVGPPLVHFSQRTYVAGQLTNSSENLAKWIQDPQEVEPGTAMPDLGVTAAEARNIAAYLLQLE